MTNPYREPETIKRYKVYDFVCPSCGLFGIATIYFHDSNRNQPLCRICIQQHNLFDENDYYLYGYHVINMILCYPSTWRYLGGTMPFYHKKLILNHSFMMKRQVFILPKDLGSFALKDHLNVI